MNRAKSLREKQPPRRRYKKNLPRKLNGYCAAANAQKTRDLVCAFPAPYNRRHAPGSKERADDRDSEHRINERHPARPIDGTWGSCGRFCPYLAIQNESRKKPLRKTTASATIQKKKLPRKLNGYCAAANDQKRRNLVCAFPTSRLPPGADQWHSGGRSAPGFRDAPT